MHDYFACNILEHQIETNIPVVVSQKVVNGSLYQIFLKTFKEDLFEQFWGIKKLIMTLHETLLYDIFFSSFKIFFHFLLFVFQLLFFKANLLMLWP